jgi:hypothetical protein
MDNKITADTPYKISRYSNVDNKLHLELSADNVYHIFIVIPNTSNVLRDAKHDLENYIEPPVNYILYDFVHNIYLNNVLEKSYSKTFAILRENTLGFFLDNIQIDNSLNDIHNIDVIHDTFVSGDRCDHIRNKKLITKSYAKWAFLLSDNRLLEMGIEHEDIDDTFL